MADIIPHLLFTLEQRELSSHTTKLIGAVIIAMESPPYIGRLLIGSQSVEDKSDLVVRGRMTADLIDGASSVSEHPGTRIARQHGELFTLFDDAAMTDRHTTVTFIRHGTYTSFVRATDRYERILQDFLTEQLK